MEIIGFVNVPGWIVGILIVIFTVCIYTWYKQSYFSRLGIKKKSTIFFFGDLFLLIKKGGSYIDDKMVEKYGKVFGMYVGNVPALVINDTEMLKQILVKDFNKFTDRPFIFPFKKRWMKSVTRAGGTHWKFLRSTLSPTFSSGKIRNMAPYIQRCAQVFIEIIDNYIKDKPDGFDIEPLIRCYTMDFICSTGFGMDVDAQRDPGNAFVKKAREISEVKIAHNPLFLINIFFPDLSFIMNKFPVSLISDSTWGFFETATLNAFKERKQDNSDDNTNHMILYLTGLNIKIQNIFKKHKDLLQLLINSHKGSKDDESSTQMSYEELKSRGLTDDEVLTNSLVFIIAGYETTAISLSWLMYEMVLNPDCQEKMMKEIESDIGQGTPEYDNVFKLTYLDMFINETLRMHSSVGRLNRLANEDVDICGVSIKKGMDVSYSLKALHFMAEYWDEPYQFDPERFSPENKHNINEYAYLPFGVGPRNCIGQRLALLEVKMTMVKLLQNFRFHITDKLEVPMPEATTGLAKPAQPVFVRVERCRQII